MARMSFFQRVEISRETGLERSESVNVSGVPSERRRNPSASRFA